MERRQDIALGLIFIGLGLAAAWVARGYAGASGIYPMTLGLVLTLLGGIVAARAARSGSDAMRELVTAPGKMVTATTSAVIYVAAVVPLGFYTASFLLMLALPVALGFRRWGFALLVAAIFITVVYLIFSVLLEKPLPRDAILLFFAPGG